MPDNVRALRGTHPERAEAKAGVKRVKLTPGAPNPPTSLKDEALREWRRIMPELDRRGLVAKVDRAIVTEYCRAWALSCEAHEILLQEGMIVESYVADGVTAWKKNPVWQIWREATAMTAALAKELLITPNARLRATMPEAEGSSGAEDILD